MEAMDNTLPQYASRFLSDHPSSRKQGDAAALKAFLNAYCQATSRFTPLPQTELGKMNELAKLWATGAIYLKDRTKTPLSGDRLIEVDLDFFNSISNESRRPQWEDFLTYQFSKDIEAEFFSRAGKNWNNDVESEICRIKYFNEAADNMNWLTFRESIRHKSSFAMHHNETFSGLKQKLDTADYQLAYLYNWFKRGQQYDVPELGADAIPIAKHELRWRTTKQPTLSENMPRPDWGSIIVFGLNTEQIRSDEVFVAETIVKVKDRVDFLKIEGNFGSLNEGDKIDYMNDIVINTLNLKLPINSSISGAVKFLAKLSDGIEKTLPQGAPLGLPNMPSFGGFLSIFRYFSVLIEGQVKINDKIDPFVNKQLSSVNRSAQSTAYNWSPGLYRSVWHLPVDKYTSETPFRN